MSVLLRKRPNSDGSTSIYLDIYHDGKRRYEFLKECKLLKANTPIERQINSDKLDLAKRIVGERSLQLQGNDYDVAPNPKAKIDFLEYFQSYLDGYKKKDIRVMMNSKQKFEGFLKEEGIKSLNTKQVTESLINDFKEYLESTLNGESPSTYFSRFKKVLKQATRDKIFKVNPANDVTIKKRESIKKEILTIEEIQMLQDTPITAVEVKRAFLICCYTGIRYVDAIGLKWKNVNILNNTISFIQSKTGNKVELQIHPTALKLLGTPKGSNELVFNLPSHTACLKNLRSWTKKAGISKHITWHSARHGFASNLLFFGADLNTVRDLMGHSSLRYVQLYTRVVDSMKQKAISNIPEIDF